MINLADRLYREPLECGSGDELAPGLRHWLARLDPEQLLWLMLDVKDEQGHSATNTLSQAVLEELGSLIADIRHRQPRGMIIRSAQNANFIVGADINEFVGADDPEAVRSRLLRAHEVVNDLAGLNLPTVALIHGHCLGGGLELALACDYRIARQDAQLGFPEVNLGLHPGLGGTLRLSRVINPANALQLMLTGRSVNARKAKSMGLIDAVAEERHMAAAARAAIAGEIKKAGLSIKSRLMLMPPVRQLIVSRARKQTAAMIDQDHYPAPFELLEIWQKNVNDKSAMLEAEMDSFSRLLTDRTARNLIRVYFLRQAIQRTGKVGSDPIKHVHVVGAGTMGGDIAAWCAHKGLLVTIEDQSAEQIAPAMARAAGLFRRKNPPARIWKAAWDRLMPDMRGSGRKTADLIIEAVPEKIELKRQVLAELESEMKEGAILASNTSGILLEELRDGLDRPERFAGLHFFNPVSRMQLIEVVRHDQAADQVMGALAAFAVQIDRLPVKVRSSPGFLVNRILMPYLMEALALKEEGVQPELIDQAAMDFGMPMGPIELADRVGLDICLEVADTLTEKLDQPFVAIPDWFRDKVAAGELGIKSGSGLYRYRDGKPVKKKLEGEPDRDLIDRLILPMVNTAGICLDEAVVKDAELLDGAMIFGTGFAPFRGGPMKYARDRGIDDIRETLQALVRVHGDRFNPSEQWRADRSEAE